MLVEPEQGQVVDDDALIATDPGEEGRETGAGSPSFVRLGSNICDLRKSAGMTLESVGER